jgi:hypothetical protein
MHIFKDDPLMSFIDMMFPEGKESSQDKDYHTSPDHLGKDDSIRG